LFKLKLIYPTQVVKVAKAFSNGQCAKISRIHAEIRKTA